MSHLANMQSTSTAEEALRVGLSQLEAGSELELAAELTVDAATLRALVELARAATTRAQIVEHRANVLEQLADRLANVQTPEQVTQVVTEFASETIGHGAVALSLAGKENGRLVLVEARHVQQEFVKRYPSFPEDSPLPMAIAHRQRRAIFFENLDDLRRCNPEAAEATSEWNRGAGASLPLMVGERSLGAIGFGFPEPRALPDDERELLAAIARQAAVALERAELLSKTQREAARIRYLAHAGTQLASTHDTREILATLARLAVPELADWAAVDLFTDDRKVDRVAVAHPDPDKVLLVEELARRYPPQLDDPADGLGQILRLGQPLLIREISPLALEQAARDADHLHVMQTLGLRSCVCVPIASRGKIRGAFTLIAAESGRRYDDDDLALALEIARRASIALDLADVLDDIRQAEQLARRADRHKDEFLAALGHELRNPLAAITSATEVLLMRERHSDPAAERAVGAIRRQAGYMKRLIDDLLDVARIARGKFQIEHQPVDFRAIVQQTVSDHGLAAERAGISVTTELPSTPLWISGDPTRLAQVVANLLLNAIKFTPAGGRVAVSLAVEENVVVLEICDTGIGIEPSKLPELFAPFVQVRSSYDRNNGGLGLGLALVKGLVELHCGSVCVESAGADQGSRFTIRLPEATFEAVCATEEASGPRRVLRVLLVEDDRDVGEMLLMMIESLGHRVLLATDGISALEMARAHKPQVVLCDIGLPGVMDGYDVARALRSDASAGSPILVAVSGFGLPDHIQRAKHAGFDRHFTKPIQPAALDEIFDLVESGRLAYSSPP